LVALGGEDVGTGRGLEDARVTESLQVADGLAGDLPRLALEDRTSRRGEAHSRLAGDHEIELHARGGLGCG